jgi:hypothetical protein
MSSVRSSPKLGWAFLPAADLSGRLDSLKQVRRLDSLPHICLGIIPWTSGSGSDARDQGVTAAFLRVTAIMTSAHKYNPAPISMVARSPK